MTLTIYMCRRKWRSKDFLILLSVVILICLILELELPDQVNEFQEKYRQVLRDVQTPLTESPETIRHNLRHQLVIQQNMADRIEDMDSMCDKLIEQDQCFNDLYEDSLKHIYVIKKYKLMFCYIPKVGCSNWKRIMMILENNLLKIDDIDSREAHARNNLTMLEDIPEEDRHWYIENYKKFMFVRHPLSRIVSAYKNKFKDLSVFRVAPIIIRRYGMRIMKKYRKDATPAELRTGENITWNEWLDYIADPTSVGRFDRHWKEMYKLCSPCAVNYDYIGKLENVNDEADHIMTKLGVSHIAMYPGKANSHPTNTTLDKTIATFKSTASDYHLKRISDVFGLDFCLFGYDKPDILP